jgi:hypothetical protein
MLSLGLGLQAPPRPAAVEQQTDLVALFVGQSLMARGFTQFSGAGRDAFIAEAEGLGFTNVIAINGARDSAGVCFGTNSTASAVGSYLDDGDDGEGTIFVDYLVAGVEDAEVAWEDIDIVFLMIGNRDRLALTTANGGPFITEADHKAGIKTLADLIKARAPNAIIVHLPNIGELGIDTQAQNEAWTAIERAQYEAVAEHADLLPGCSLDDITRTDSQHPDEAGHVLQFQRMARLAAHYLGRPVNNPLGASVTAASYDGDADTITVTISHDDGTDFAGTIGAGWWAYVNGAYQKPTTLTRIDADTFTLSGGLTLAAEDVVTFSYAAGTHEDMGDPATDIFIDNATNPLPIRHVFGFVVEDATPPPPSYTPMDEIDAACVADWRAGVQDSYDSAASTSAWKNLCATGSAYDLTIDTGNTTFNGLVGDTAAYFTEDGSGKLAQLTGANPSVIANFGKTTGGQDFTVIIAMRVADTAASRALFTTHASLAGGTNDGVRAHINGTENMIHTQLGNSGTAVSGTAIAVGTGDKYLIVGHDHASNQTEQAVNSTSLTTISHTYDTTTDNASQKFTIFAESDDGVQMDAGARLYGVWVFAAKPSDLDLAAIVAEIQATTPL